MGIIAGIVAAMGVIIAVLVRLNTAADAAKGLVESAGDAHGLFRRWKWRRQLANNQLAMVDDARIAAAVMVVTSAQHDGALTQRESDWITSQFQTMLGLTAVNAEALLSHARFIAKDAHDLDQCFRKLTPLIRANCGPVERAQLLDMLTAVMALEKPIEEPERQSIQRLAEKLRT